VPFSSQVASRCHEAAQHGLRKREGRRRGRAKNGPRDAVRGVRGREVGPRKHDAEP